MKFDRIWYPSAAIYVLKNMSTWLNKYLKLLFPAAKYLWFLAHWNAAEKTFENIESSTLHKSQKETFIKFIPYQHINKSYLINNTKLSTNGGENFNITVFILSRMEIPARYA